MWYVVIINPMRINFLIPHLKLSGGISVSMSFAHELSLRGHDVFVVVESKSPTRFIRNLITIHPLLPWGTRVKIVRVKNFSDLPDKGVFIADSWQVARKLHNMNIRGPKFHHLQHDERMHHGERAIVESVYRLPMKKMVNATWIHKALKEELGLDVEILFNSIDCEQFHPNKRTRLPHDNTIRIAVLHHDYAWKRTQDGVDVVMKLKEKYPEKNIKLILFGTRTKHNNYPCDEYHYNVVGDKLAELFANSDIFIGPSLDDSRAIIHRWAMAAGCAIAIYDNVSVDDYAFHEKTAMIAKKGDVNDLFKKTEMLVIDEVLRKKIAQQALDYVRKLPTWAELTSKLERILEGNENIN